MQPSVLLMLKLHIIFLISNHSVSVWRGSVQVFVSSVVPVGRETFTADTSWLHQVLTEPVREILTKEP